MLQLATGITPPPPPPPAILLQCGLSIAIDALLSSYHTQHYTLLFDKQFVPYCTTKYIFKIGKNKFDRGGQSANDFADC
jgi:hypothetical protein